MLPTRFGNVNRAFESYAAQAYDVEATLIWPRLNSIIPKEHQSLLADFRAQVNCFVNLVVLAIALAGLRAIVSGFYGLAAALHDGWPGLQAWAERPDVASSALFVAGCLMVAALSYEAAIGRAIALGEQVKVAFDLYLPTLPAKLGYLYPSDETERRKFWAKLEGAFDFHQRLDGLELLPIAAISAASSADGDHPASAEEKRKKEKAEEEEEEDEEEEEEQREA